MPATSPDALARQAARANERRKERRATDLDYAARVAAKERERRQARGVRPRKKSTRAKPASRLTAPFVGCDGEGVGGHDASDPDHRYALLRMGDRELYAGGRRLTTPELLDFICEHPADQLCVGFAFDYDASNILRDVPRGRERPDVPSRLERLLAIDTAFHRGDPNPYNQSSWTFLDFDGYPGFAVDYRPRNYLRVARTVRTMTTLPDGRRERRQHVVKGSSRTIYDTYANFQGSFLTAIRAWEIGPSHWEAIAAMKAARETFVGITREVRDYCRLECELLAKLMEEFRTVCVDAGMIPRTWNGAGKIAAGLLEKHEALKRADVERLVPAPVLDLAHAAFYGGRFEIARVGWVGGKEEGPVYEHDISSAYPAAMLRMPCLVHGVWRRMGGSDLAALPDNALYLCPVRFHHPASQHWCGLPFRSKDKRLCWPREGNGIYWSCEIRSAMRLGATITHRAGYVYETRCQCKQFEWVQELYKVRKAVGKSKKGRAIRLGMNALYGKHAQRIGAATYQNLVYAGLMTAFTRAALNDAIAAHVAAGGWQRDVIMIATDGLYTVRRPAPVDIGPAMGQWERSEYRSLFIVQPGLYWPPKPRGKAWKIKSRGLSPKFFEPRVQTFQRKWWRYRRWAARAGDAFVFIAESGKLEFLAPPKVDVTVPLFVGLRLSYRRNKPELCCQWTEVTKAISFDWTLKRGPASWTSSGRGLITESQAGSPGAHSAIYIRDPGEAGEGADDRLDWRLRHIELEAMPDVLDLTTPFKDEY